MAASAQYSVTVRVELDARQEPLGKLTGAIAEAGGALQSVDLVPGAGSEGKRVREFTVDANSPEHWEQILRSIGSTRGARVLGFTDRTFAMHRNGKIEQHNKYPLKTRDDLSMAYTPGVARVCEYIAADRTKAFDYTIKANTVAVVSDGGEGAARQVLGAIGLALDHRQRLPGERQRGLLVGRGRTPAAATVPASGATDRVTSHRGMLADRGGRGEPACFSNLF